MGSVTWKSGRKVELASLSAGDGFGRGIRALARATRWIGRTWRGLVESVGKQTYYLTGPSPWAVRDMVRQGQRDDDGGRRVGGEADGRAGTPKTAPGSRGAGRRSGPLVGAR